MKNLETLNQNLSTIIDGLLAGSMEPKIATEVINAAGKIIKGHAVELAYCEHQKSTRVIKFFEPTAS